MAASINHEAHMGSSDAIGLNAVETPAILAEIERLSRDNKLWEIPVGAPTPAGTHLLSRLQPRDLHAPHIPVMKDATFAVRLSQESVNHFLSCQICYSIMKDTRCIKQCLHRFCQDCMEQSLRVLQNECPSCRVRVPSRRSCKEDKRFNGLISTLYPDREGYEAKELERLAASTAETRAYAAALAAGSEQVSDHSKHKSESGSASDTTGSKKRPRSSEQSNSGNPAKVSRSSMGEQKDGTQAVSASRVSNSQPAETKSAAKPAKALVSFNRANEEQNLPNVNKEGANTWFLVPYHTKVRSLKKFFCDRFKEKLGPAATAMKTDVAFLRDKLRFSVVFSPSGQQLTQLTDSDTLELLAERVAVDLAAQELRITVIYASQ